MPLNSTAATDAGATVETATEVEEAVQDAVAVMIVFFIALLCIVSGGPETKRVARRTSFPRSTEFQITQRKNPEL